MFGLQKHQHRVAIAVNEKFPESDESDSNSDESDSDSEIDKEMVKQRNLQSMFTRWNAKRACYTSGKSADVDSGNAKCDQVIYGAV